MTLDNGTTITFRELKPKDFYFFSLIENDYPDISPNHLIILVIMRLGGLSDDDLAKLPSRYVQVLSNWIVPNLLEEKVMKLEQWLEMAFHFCKQRWDHSIDWLEEQPISKVLLMARILSEFVSKQNEENKRAARKKK